MLQLRQCFAIGVTNLLLASVVYSANAQVFELEGTVVEVAGPEVAIQVLPAHLPQPGSRIDIVLQEENGTRNEGAWRVLKVEDDLVWVTAEHGTQLPTRGQLAKLYTYSPPDAEAPEPSVEPERPCSVVSPSGIQPALELLSSSNSVDQQRGAKVLYRHYRKCPDIQLVAQETLLRGYDTDPGDRYHVDAMAWLCNILGASRSPEYTETLITVAKGSASHKLSDYAWRNLYRLR